VAHYELRFNLLYCVHSDANHDQQRGAAEVEGEAETVGDKCRKCVEVATDEPQVVEVDTSHEHRRNQLNDDQVAGANQRDPREHIVDKVRRPASGPDSRNKAAVFAHVIGDVVGTKNDGDIEISEKDNREGIEQDVPRFAGNEIAEDGPRNELSWSRTPW